MCIVIFFTSNNTCVIAVFIIITINVMGNISTELVVCVQQIISINVLDLIIILVQCINCVKQLLVKKCKKFTRFHVWCTSLRQDDTWYLSRVKRAHNTHRTIYVITH